MRFVTAFNYSVVSFCKEKKQSGKPSKQPELLVVAAPKLFASFNSTKERLFHSEGESVFVNTEVCETVVCSKDFCDCITVPSRQGDIYFNESSMLLYTQRILEALGLHVQNSGHTNN